jgi:biopolymer transport protein ExbB
VLAYNWLQRRNKAIVEELARFSNDLHGYMMSGGAVKPAVSARPAAATAGAAKAGSAASGSAQGTTTPGLKKV